MKRSLFIIALMGIMLQNLSKVIIFVNFEVNRAYIAQNLCVKRNEKKNCCKGKCQLNKRLADDDKKDNSTASRSLKEESNLQLFAQQYNPFDLNNKETSIVHKTNYLLAVPQDVSKDCFRPPCFIA